MALGDLIDVTSLLNYNYPGVQSNGNSATLYFDYDAGTGNYKGTAALTENQDGSLTFWFYDQNLEDSTAYGGHVYGETFQFTWSTNNGTSIDKSGSNSQQALCVYGGPIPKAASSYSFKTLIQSYANTARITPSFDVVAVPVRGGVSTPDSASAIYVFRARLYPTGGKGTVLSFANVSHYENGDRSNTLYNDSAGPCVGTLSLTLQGALHPTITAVTPVQSAHGTKVVLTGTQFDPSFTVYFGSSAYPATVLAESATSITCLVPQGIALDATTIYLSNGSTTSNSIAFTVAANTLYSGYSNELALTFAPAGVAPPPPSPVVGLTIVPNTATITEGNSQQFTAVATLADGRSVTLRTGATWSVSNVNGAGSIDPNTGLFVAQTAGSRVVVTAQVPVGYKPDLALAPGQRAPWQGASAFISATASVIIAARILVPQLVGIAITPADTEIATTTQLQLQAVGTSQLGGIMYPQVTWAVQPGLQTVPRVAPQPGDFIAGGTQGIITLATAIANGNGTLGASGGTFLVSATLSDYLEAGEFFWTEWQAANTTSAFGPAIADGNGTFLSVAYNAGAGTIALTTSATMTLDTWSAPSGFNPGSAIHTMQLGLLRIDDTHTRVVVFVDETKLYDRTLAFGWIDVAIPAFYSAAPNASALSSLRAFTSSAAAVDGTATIDAYGLLTATRAGQVTVVATATDGSGVSGQTTLTITDPAITQAPAHLGSVTITPQAATCQAGSTIQFTATVVDQYGNPYPDVSIAWAVHNTAGAGTIDPVSGLFTGQISGSQITVTATAYALDDEGNVVIIGFEESYLAASASAAVVVIPGPIQKITVIPDPVILHLNQSQQFTAYGYDSWGNELMLTSSQWSVSGGVGTITSGGFFTATSSGVGKVLASQNGISGSAFANVLAEVGGVTVSTVPQQPFARVHLRDVVDQPVMIDARTRGGGLRRPNIVDINDDFWWDLSRYDGVPFHGYGVYAINVQGPAPQRTPDLTTTAVQDVLGKFAAPQFLPVLVPGSAAPASSL